VHEETHTSFSHDFVYGARAHKRLQLCAITRAAARHLVPLSLRGVGFSTTSIISHIRILMMKQKFAFMHPPRAYPRQLSACRVSKATRGTARNALRRGRVQGDTVSLTKLFVPSAVVCRCYDRRFQNRVPTPISTHTHKASPSRTLTPLAQTLAQRASGASPRTSPVEITALYQSPLGFDERRKSAHAQKPLHREELVPRRLASMELELGPSK